MLSIFFVGIALSMDAFSIALSIGTLNLPKTKLLLLPVITGIMHFIMPMLGVLLGNQLLNIININPKLIVAIIFLYLAVVMYFDKKHENIPKITSFLSVFLFAFSVSIDSFSVGLGLKGLTDNYILSFLTFTVCSFSFTYIGLILGKYSVKILKEKATYLGILILIVLALANICQIFLN